MSNIIDDRERQLEEQVREIRKNIDKAHKSRNGLNIAEIMVLYYARTYKTDRTDFPRFWYYQYGIDDVRKVLDKLQNEGFIIPASAVDSLKNFKVAELKEILKELNLKQTGKKEELASRIAENADPQYLDNIVKSRNYTLTDKGRQELDENQYIPYFHKVNFKYAVSVFWMNEQLFKYPGHNYRDLIWGKLNRDMQQAIEDTSNDKYSLYIQTSRRMSEFCIEEKRYNDALRSEVEAVYYEICFEYPKMIKYSENLKFSEIYTLFLSNFSKIQKGLDATDNELFQKIVEYLTARRPEKVIPHTDLAGLIVSELNHDTNTAKGVYLQIENKIRQQIYSSQARVQQNRASSPPTPRPTIAQPSTRQQQTPEKKGFFEKLKNLFN